MGLFFPDYGTSFGKQGGQKTSILGVAAAHAALFGLIAVSVPAEQLADLARPFTARLIELAPDIPQSSQPPPPRQTPKKVQPTVQPILVANTPTPTPNAAAFTVAPQPSAVTVATPIAAPTVTPLTAARFDADYLNNPKPTYPPASRRLHEEGEVVLRVRVSAEGHPESVEIKQSSGFPRLDRAAEAAVSRWRFVPARRGDVAIAVWIQVPITFNLQG
ncbi:energy transducer TonB [Propionivibrio sp.]|uniref:energy transducer TonB n=1 Tax=Propionivibrio sp. TaxID=2212460 RepID=UPI003BF21CBB